MNLGEDRAGFSSPKVQRISGWFWSSAVGIVAFRTGRKGIGGDRRTWLEMGGDRWIGVTVLSRGCSGWTGVVVGNE